MLNIVKFIYVLRGLGLSIRAWTLFVRYNFFSIIFKRKILLYLNRFVRLNVDRKEDLEINKTVTLGNLSSSKEISISVKRNGKLIFDDFFQVFPNTKISVFGGGILKLSSGFINERSEIICGNKIIIDDDVAIGCGVIIRDYDFHFIDYPGYQRSKPIFIGKHVWIGENSMICKGVTIGEHSVIAAGAIVTKDVPAHTIVAGVPAIVVKNNIDWSI